MVQWEVSVAGITEGSGVEARPATARRVERAWAAFPGSMDEGKEITSDPAGRRQDDAENGIHGDGGVDGIATAAHDLDPRLRCEVMG